MDWAGQQGLDSATLKRAKVPLYGKWYFPDLPANEPMVNLSTGEIETFPPGYRAGAVLYVKDADLKKAGLGPYKAAPAPAPVAAATPAPVAEPAAVAAAPAVAPTPRPAPAPVAAAVAHESAAHQEARMEAAHSVGHAAPLRGDVVEHAHPGSKEYVIIAMILAVITALEVAVYYIPAVHQFIVPILIVLSAVKFWMVVAFFMHLKFDHISFSWYFGGGLALALAMSSSVVVLQIATHGLPHGY